MVHSVCRSSCLLVTLSSSLIFDLNVRGHESLVCGLENSFNQKSVSSSQSLSFSYSLQSLSVFLSIIILEDRVEGEMKEIIILS